MGIPQLQSYIEKACPSDCFYKVNIEQLAKNYREQTGGYEPVIVVDGSSCIGFIYKGLDWVAGGQFKQLFEKLDAFIKSFKRIGVRLVFFFTGGTVGPKRRKWIERSYQKQDEIHMIFDKLAKGWQVEELEKWQMLPTGVGSYDRFFFQYILQCEVHVSVDEDDTEIAHYARKNQCFAILAQDTDYLIYEGAPYYISALHLNLTSMSSYIYDRKKLMIHLGLETFHMPLFASLAGCDRVSFEDLKPFHRRIKFEFNKPNQFVAVAEYIKRYGFNSEESIFDSLTLIAKEALNDPEARNVLEISIRCYMSSTPLYTIPSTDHPHWNDILQRAEELHRFHHSLQPNMILNVLSGEPFEDGYSFEDFRKEELPKSGCLLRPIRMRLYGILLHEKPPKLDPILVHEWSMESLNSLEADFRVKPIPPIDAHPGLLALWSDDRTREMQTARWQLFAHSLSPDLDFGVLTDLPDNLILPTAVFFFLQKKNFLEEWEIESLIATVVALPSVPTEKLASLPANPVNLRAVQIGTIYMQAIFISILVFSACGYPLPASQVFIHPYFDGKLHQKMYSKFEKNTFPYSLMDPDQDLGDDLERNRQLSLFSQIKARVFLSS